jgi:DNA primase
MSNFPIVTLLESVLGKGRLKANNNVAFNCPFCHHHKPKLEVNTQSQHWHCWVCNAAGRKLPILFKRLNVERSKISKLIVLLEDVEYRPKKTTTDTPVLHLPESFRPLWVFDKGSPEYRNAVFYLRKRGLTIEDILKYRIGYCDAGLYSGKIVIPSFDANGSLNYFVSRAYYEDDVWKHKNPNVSKDIIGFELHINWDMPIVLVEGAFDAIAIKRNAIPLFGKTISNTLKKRIVERGVKTIYICLDDDAKKQAIEVSDYFMSNGIDVHLVKLPDNSDPSELGFEQVKSIIDNTCPLTGTQLMQEKILCKL